MTEEEQLKEKEKILDAIRRTADVIVEDADRGHAHGTIRQRGESIRHMVDMLKEKWGAR